MSKVMPEQAAGTPSGAGENKVSLAADTPASATVAQGAQNVIFAKINFCAASAANTVSKIILTRGGIAADADISAVKLYEGTTQVGSTQALNTTNHKATFSSLSWTIPANSCKVLTVKGSIAGLNTATSGDTPKFSIAAAADITSTVTLDGVFPIESKGMTIAGIAAGSVVIATSTSPSGTIIAGATEQSVAEFNLTASSTEGMKIHSVKITEVGSSVDADVANIKLYYQSTQLGSTTTALTNGSAEFDLSAAPLEILAGSSKKITVYVDVGTGTGIADRNIKFQITQNVDVTAYGSNSGGSLVIYGYSQGADEWPLKGQSMNIDLGTLIVTQDSTYSPAAQSYSRGTTQDKVVAFKFSAGAYEGVRITQIKLKEAVASSSDSDFNNVTLYDAETDTVLAGPAGVVSGYVTFGSYTTGLDATGLFDIAEGKNRIILVKADVSSAAAISPNQLGFQILNSQTDVKADGLESANDLATTDITPSTALGNTLLHNVIGTGTITVGPNSNTPSASTYSVGTTDFTFAKFDLTSTGEDIKVTQFNVLFATSTNATTTNADAADVNNVKLYDGTTLLKTVSNISSGYAQFAINVTVPKNGTKVLTVKGDIPTGSDAAVLQAWLQKAGDITAEGVSSAVAITATAASWSNVKGNAMTKGVPGLVIKRADTPATQTLVKNTSGVTVATLNFTASTSENLTVTRIKIVGSATSSASSSLAQGRLAFNDTDSSEVGLVVRNMVGNVKLYDGATQLGTVVPAMTDSTNFDYADFTGLSLKITKGQTKAIDIKLDVTDATTTTGNTAVYFFFGIASGTADVAGSGDDSGTALAAATITTNTNGEPGNGMLFGSSGTLTVMADVDTANSAIQVAGATGVNFGSWKFIASNEGMSITRLAFTITTSTAATGTSVSYNARPTLLYNLATSTVAQKHQYAFNYSFNDGATETCTYWWGCSAVTATSTDTLMAVLNSASSTCWASSSAGIVMASSTGAGAISLYASPAGNYSLEITDLPNSASNTADELKLGLKYGGTETIGAYDGSDSSLGSAYLYDGSTLLGTTQVGAVEGGKVVFSWTDASPLSISKGSRILTLKTDLKDYTSLSEGATLYFTLGSTVGTGKAIEGKGAQSGTALSDSNVSTSSLAVNTMYLYSTKPTVTLNSSSPSGSKTVSASQEVFRFDVTNANTGLDMAINAIRFSISSDATSTWYKTFTVYKSTDLSTAIGSGVAYANASTTDTTGWVTIYPYSSSGWQVGSGSTNTYMLYGNTSAMNITTGSDALTISIASDDFFWDDSVLITGAVNANKKVLNLPVTGGTLTY
ncbi:MAG: hypothetical protein HY979_01475 [Candidatus Magasanikbacteria bacterium]|nr:hypothetical protein [Candidatus Magasanikbacteria bacterium]